MAKNIPATLTVTYPGDLTTKGIKTTSFDLEEFDITYRNNIKTLEEFLYAGFDRMFLRKFLIDKGFSRANVCDVTTAVATVGSNTDNWVEGKIVNKNVVTRLRNLVENFDIQPNKTRASEANNKTLVTPARIMLAFADIVIAFIEQNVEFFKPLIKGIQPADLPVSFCWPGSIMFIPLANTRVRLAYIAWALSFDYTIAIEKGKIKNKSEWDFRMAYGRVSRFAAIQAADKTTEETRALIWAKLKKEGVHMGTSSTAAILTSIGKGDTGDYKTFLDKLGVDLSEVKTVESSTKKTEEKKSSNRNKGKAEKEELD